MAVRRAKATRAEPTGHIVAVVGAGPAGMYAARALANAGHEVVILNRDIKHGGLAEYGIYPDKHKMKGGLRKQFWAILDDERISYMGHVRVANDEGSAMSLDELRGLGFSAVVLAVGAQGTKLLGLPREEAEGVYHAKDLVYWYNHLPPFADMSVSFGKSVAIIGVGNVMVDIAHWLVIHEPEVEEIVVLSRRGPVERKYTPKEISYVAAAFDQDHLRGELERIRPRLEAVGQDIDEIWPDLTKFCDAPLEGPTNARMRFKFLTSPVSIETDERGKVRGVKVEHNVLEDKGEWTACRGTGEFEVLSVDTVVYAIGDSVDTTLGLPHGKDGFLTANEGESYQAQDGEPLDGVFLVGWARRASDGLVGKARQDAEIGCVEVNDYLGEATPPGDAAGVLKALTELLGARSKRYATAADVRRIVEIETARAESQGVPEFKFGSDEAMFAALDD